MEQIQDSFSKLSLKSSPSCVWVFHHSTCLAHKSSKKHPEQPARIQAVLKNIKTCPNIKIISMDSYISPISAQAVHKLAEELHGSRYVEFVQQMWDQSSTRIQMYINTDTYYCKSTYQAALAAAMTTITATDCALNQPHPRTFAAVRPPGHHSGLKSQPHGFSFLNNAALAAQYAIKTKSLTRVVIVDWDAHHGEGTQTMFYRRKDVLYLSLHRFDKGKFFPHIIESGSENVGQGEGKGYNINVCWNLPQKGPGTVRQSTQTVGDVEYAHAFQKIVMPVLKEYNPQLVIVSCGFDSAEGDPIGALKITNQGYGLMVQSLVSLSKPIVAVLEGGYNLEVLQWGGDMLTKSLSSSQSLNFNLKQRQCNSIGKEGIDQCLKHIAPFWKSLSFAEQVK